MPHFFGGELHPRGDSFLAPLFLPYFFFHTPFLFPFIFFCLPSFSTVLGSPPPSFPHVFYFPTKTKQNPRWNLFFWQKKCPVKGGVLFQTTPTVLWGGTPPPHPPPTSKNHLFLLGRWGKKPPGLHHPAQPTNTPHKHLFFCSSTPPTTTLGGTHQQHPPNKTKNTFLRGGGGFFSHPPTPLGASFRPCRRPPTMCAFITKPTKNKNKPPFLWWGVVGGPPPLVFFRWVWCFYWWFLVGWVLNALFTNPPTPLLGGVLFGFTPFFFNPGGQSPPKKTPGYFWLVFFTNPKGGPMFLCFRATPGECSGATISF